METTVGQSGSINYSYLGTVAVQQYRSFFVNGEVRNPGSYGYEPGLTLAKAVSLAGGMTDRASRRKITLTREVDGDKKDYQVELSQSIEPGDIITIKEGFF